jgi:uncharacterized membrane protein YfcA
MGNVDKKMAFFLLLTAAAGIRLAVWIMTVLFAAEGDSHGQGKGAGANLYISLVFLCVLSLVSLAILRDAIQSLRTEGASPSRRITDFLARLNLYPVIHFPASDVRVSLWILLLVGLATGYLAGTIGVGGFIGVPAMIYVFGMPTAVAAGTELFLAMFMGAWGALNFAFAGMVDIRLVILMYLGSLVGIHIGAYGTKVVKEVMIRLVTGIIIILCVISRAVAIPVYMRQLGWVEFDPAWDYYFNLGSKALLFVSGITGCLAILVQVFRAYVRRRRVHVTIATTLSGERGSASAESA